MKKTFLPALFMALLCGVAIGEEMPVKDVSISIILPGEINVSEEYTRIFRLVNHNSVTGEDDGLLVNVKFNITLNGTLVEMSSVNRSLNSYTETGMGSVNVSEPGNYELCASITSLNYEDTNPGNDKACHFFQAVGIGEEMKMPGNETGKENKTSPVNETEEVFNFCECTTKVVTDKELYYKGERMLISFNTCNETFSEYPYKLEYWVEDLFGEIMKQKLNTTNPSQKQFTPRFEGHEKAFKVKARFPECNNTASPAITVFREEEREAKKPFLALSLPEKAVPGEVFFVGVEGFKGDTRKTVLSLWIENNDERVSEVTKTYIYGSNKEFSQSLPLLIARKNLEPGLYNVVAEGLDFEEKEQLYLEVMEEEEESKETGINSFYTRKQNFDGSLNVFVTTSNSEGLLLKVKSSKNVFESYMPRSNSLSASMNISSPTEILVAELYDEEEIISTETLALSLSYEEPEPIVEEVDEEKEEAETFEQAKAEVIVTNDTGIEEATPEEEDEPRSSNAEVFESRISEYWLLIIGSVFIVAALFGKDTYKAIKNKKFFK